MSGASVTVGIDSTEFKDTRLSGTCSVSQSRASCNAHRMQMQYKRYVLGVQPQTVQKVFQPDYRVQNLHCIVNPINTYLPSWKSWKRREWVQLVKCADNAEADFAHISLAGSRRNNCVQYFRQELHWRWKKGSAILKGSHCTPFCLWTELSKVFAEGVRALTWAVGFQRKNWRFVEFLWRWTVQAYFCLSFFDGPLPAICPAYTLKVDLIARNDQGNFSPPSLHGKVHNNLLLSSWEHGTKNQW